MFSSRLLLLSLLALAACGGEKTSDSGAGTTGETNDAGEGGETTDGGDVLEPEYPSGSPTGCDLTGTSYQLDFTTARVIQPQQLGPILADAIGDVLAMGVAAQTDSSVSLVLALTDGGVQDLCTPTVQPPDGTWADPVFAVGPADVSVDIDGTAATLSSFQFTAAAGASCNTIESGVFQTDLDVRLLASALGSILGSEDPDEMCETLLSLGGVCEACESDSDPYCIKLVVDQLASPDRGTPLQVVTQTEIDANADCG